MGIDVSRIEGVTGTFDTNKDNLSCVGNSKYGSVSLCFKSNMHITFANIKLYSSGRAIDADATFDDAYALGNEIAERFNHFTEKCTWERDNPEEFSDTWNASCSEQFVLFDGTPLENKMKFCPFCGKEIEEK